MADLEAATKGDLLELQTLLLRHLESFEDRISVRFAATDQKTENVRMEMLERIEASETKLLIATQVWAVPVNGRIRKLELGDSNLGERLAAIEDRLMALERHQPPGFIPGVTH